MSHGGNGKHPVWEAERAAAEDAAEREEAERVAAERERVAAELGKRAAAELDAFLAEYARVTGRHFASCAHVGRLAADTPDEAHATDFVFADSDGYEATIALVGIALDPAPEARREVLEPEDGLAQEAAERVIEAIAVEALRRGGLARDAAAWRILVLQLTEPPVADVVRCLDDEFFGLGMVARGPFHEIWAADYASLEASGTVQLFGITPAKFRGLHPNR